MPDSDLDRLEQQLRSELAAAAREEAAGEEAAVSARMARIERITRLREASSSLSPMRKRWPLAAVAATTLALLSLLLFAHQPRTEIELEVTLDQVAFDLAAMQTLTRTTTVAALGASGLRQVQAASLEQGVIPTTMVHVSGELSGGSVTLDPLKFPKQTRVWIHSGAADGTLQISWTAQPQTIQLDLSGAVKTSLTRGTPQHHDLPSPRPLLLEVAGDTVDLELRPDKPQPVFESQLKVAALSFAHIDESVDADNTTLREISTIRSGTLYLEGLGGQAIPLRDGEPLKFESSSGILRSLRVADEGLVLRFRGTVSGMRTGWGNAQRTLMPNYLEWLMARHGLGLLWGTTLYVFGILLSLIKWWGFRK